MQEIVNKVKQQDKLITLDLEKYHPGHPIYEFDIKDYLFKGLILKEKEFRKALKEFDWSEVDGKYVSVFCSTDAIVAKWAYMLVAAKAKDHAREVFFGQKDQTLNTLYQRKLDQINWEQFEEKFVLLKGCSDNPIPESVYLYATKKLLPVVRKLMYGEACSSVPVYNKPRN